MSIRFISNNFFSLFTGEEGEEDDEDADPDYDPNTDKNSKGQPQNPAECKQQWPFK